MADTIARQGPDDRRTAKPKPSVGTPNARAANDYKIVCVRLRTAEFEQFSAEARAFDLTGSMALRIAARRIGGFLEIDPEVRQCLEQMLCRLGTLSQAVRTLHADCAVNGDPAMDRLEEQRAAFGHGFAQLDGLLRSILNVSQRRVDGRRMLAEATR